MKKNYAMVLLVLMLFIGCTVEEEKENEYALNQSQFDEVKSNYKEQETSLTREKIIPIKCTNSLAKIKTLDVVNLQGYKIYAYQKRVIAFNEVYRRIIEIQTGNYTGYFADSINRYADEDFPDPSRNPLIFSDLPETISKGNIVVDRENDIITDYLKFWVEFKCDGSFQFSDVAYVNSLSLNSSSVYFKGITTEVENTQSGLSLSFLGGYTYEYESYTNDTTVVRTETLEGKGYIRLKNDQDITVCDSTIDLYSDLLPFTVGKIEKTSTCY